MSLRSYSDNGPSLHVGQWDQDSEFADSGGYYEKFKAKVHIGEWFSCEETLMHLERAEFVYKWLFFEEVKYDANDFNRIWNMVQSNEGLLWGTFEYFLQSWAMLEDVVEKAAHVAQKILQRQKFGSEDLLWVGMLSISGDVIRQMRTWVTEKDLKFVDNELRQYNALALARGRYLKLLLKVSEKTIDPVPTFVSLTWFLKMVMELLLHVKKEVLDPVDKLIAVMMGLNGRLGQNSMLSLLPADLVRSMILYEKPRGFDVMHIHRPFRVVNREAMNFSDENHMRRGVWYNILMQWKTLHGILDGEDLHVGECRCILDAIPMMQGIMKKVCEHFRDYGIHKGGVLGVCLSGFRHPDFLCIIGIEQLWREYPVSARKVRKAMKKCNMQEIRDILIDIFYHSDDIAWQRWLYMSRYYVMVFEMLEFFPKAFY